MKKALSPLAALSLFCLVACAPSGCASFERNTYKATGSITVAVNAAMVAWGDFVKAGFASAEQEAKVRGAYLKYQAADLAVIDSAIAYHTNKDQATVDQALAALTAASADVIELVRQFLPADKAAGLKGVK